MQSATDRLVPIRTRQLELGMYVAELDRSWLHTPFDVRGFLLTQESQLEMLQGCCEYVYIDPKRSESLATLGREGSPSWPAYEPDAADRVEMADLDDCRTVLREARVKIANSIRAARNAGRLEIMPVTTQLDQFVDQVLKSPDTIQWLLATEPVPGHLNRRSLGTAVFTIIFGRQIGLDQTSLRQLAIGALILDIGKTAVPITILSKPNRLNPTERSFARRHVDGSIRLVSLNARLDRRVVEMVSAHHERLDGSGYPRRLAGTEIPLFARIAGIADTFDAMTQDRGYARARSGHAALRYLNTWRAIKFDAALIDEFVRAVGVYPVGTGVELFDGSIGIVCRHNQATPTRPDVLLHRDPGGDRMTPARLAAPLPDSRIRRALPNMTALS